MVKKKKNLKFDGIKNSWIKAIQAIEDASAKEVKFQEAEEDC